MFEKEPLPEERGELGPPRYRPPTAVGIATPEPPQRSPDRWVTLVPLPLLRPALIALLGIALGLFITISRPAQVPAPVGWFLVVAGVTLLLQLWIRVDNAPVRSWRAGHRLRHDFRAYVPPQKIDIATINRARS